MGVGPAQSSASSVARPSSDTARTSSGRSTRSTGMRAASRIVSVTVANSRCRISRTLARWLRVRDGLTSQRPRHGCARVHGSAPVRAGAHDGAGAPSHRRSGAPARPGRAARRPVAGALRPAAPPSSWRSTGSAAPGTRHGHGRPRWCWSCASRWCRPRCRGTRLRTSPTGCRLCPRWAAARGEGFAGDGHPLSALKEAGEPAWRRGGRLGSQSPCGVWSMICV
jgi:hypothetical protein